MLLFNVLCLLLSGSANAQNTDPYYNLSKVKRYVTIETVANKESSRSLNKSADDPVKQPVVVKQRGQGLPQNPWNFPGNPDYQVPAGSSISNSALEVIEVYNAIWKIIEDNKPVVDIDSNSFGFALPKIAETDWTVMGGWKPERNVTITTEYENYLGMTVVKVQYQVKVVYGGNVLGRGLYVASARIVPIDVQVAWGFKLDVNVSNGTVMNVRTVEDPIGAVQMNVQYIVATVFKQTLTTDTFQVQGDGLIQDTKSGETLARAVLK